MNPAESTCPEGGATVAGGRAGCQTLFDEGLAREFGDFRYGRLHRLTVDSYSLQHPSEYMRSGKSYAAHLTGMCAAIERNDARDVNEAVQRWLGGPKPIQRPSEPPPLARGSLTVAHVHAAADPGQHLARVREWARTTWEAWREYHALARQWIEQASAARDRK